MTDGRGPAQGGDYVCAMRPSRAGLIALLLPLLCAPVTGAAAQTSCAAPLALVLSGGGAKGLAHIGVLQVLDSLGVRPDLVVGASMGSIVGAMYASGMGADQIAQQARDLHLADIFSADPRTPRSLGLRRPLVVWEPGTGGFRTGDAGARESGVNAALNRILLRGNLLARGNFDSLPIPFRAVSTDLRTKELVVLSGGDLARAVRASAAIPLVFQPERIDDRNLVDGGLAANVPVGVARREGAVRVIVSDVSWRPPDSIRTDNPLVIADLLVAYLFTQPLDSLGPGDRLIRPAIDSFATLDFAPEKVDSIIRRGYRAARASFATYPACPAAPPPPDRRTPTDFRLLRLGVEGGQAGDELVLRRQLGLFDGDPIDVAALRTRLGAMGETDVYREVWLSPSGPPDSLTLSMVVRPAPSRLAVAGLAYDNDLGGQMWVGGVDRGTVIPGLETSGTMVLGELRQEAGVGLRRAVLGPFLRYPFLSAMVAREEVRRFTPGGDLIRPERTREVRGMFGLERGFGREWGVAAGGLAHAWDASGANRYNGLGGFLQISSGPHYRLSGLWVEAAATSAYTLIKAEARQSIPVAGLRVTPTVRFGWGRHLPFMSSFMLGGIDGFPGLNIGELRGDRELYAHVSISRPLLGPIEGRLTAASGQAAFGGPTLPEGRWQVGGRIGLAAETPIGPIRVEYALARDERNGFFVRVGEWF